MREGECIQSSSSSSSTASSHLVVANFHFPREGNQWGSFFVKTQTFSTLQGD